MAKARVAPLKELTLPQLELMGAVIGSRLARHIQSALGCTKVVLWSDSQIVLHWLDSNKQLKRFITNHIKEINTHTKDYEWKYCPTNYNPADLLTRGISIDQYKNSDLWRKGPAWLVSPEKYPINPTTSTLLINDTEDNPRSESNDDSMHDNGEGIHKCMDVHRYGSFRKLIRITAYILRFVSNCRKQKESRNKGLLNSDEIQNSTKLWIRTCQQTNFSTEYTVLRTNGKVSRSVTRIRQLGLFLDHDFIIRSPGRIENAQILETAKYPYLLPRDHRISNLIVQDAHERTLNGGINMTISHLRQTFWIPAAREIARKVIRQCVTCRKVIGKPYNAPDPPPLPKSRIQEAPPFSPSSTSQEQG